MAKEIERKFLLERKPSEIGPGVAIRQGYLSRSPTVRVRTAGERGVLTIKGPPTGISRDEFEYDIPLDDAHALLALCHGRIVEKTRFLCQSGGHTWEIDEFHGDNEGLLLAEIELESEHEPFSLPEWLGAEVTADPRYTNAALSLNPLGRREHRTV